MVAGGRNDFDEQLDSCEVNISGQKGWKILDTAMLPKPMEGLRGVSIYPSFYIVGKFEI